jgi:hypothetical protein
MDSIGHAETCDEFDSLTIQRLLCSLRNSLFPNIEALLVSQQGPMFNLTLSG